MKKPRYGYLPLASFKIFCYINTAPEHSADPQEATHTGSQNSLVTGEKAILSKKVTLRRNSVTPG